MIQLMILEMKPFLNTNHIHLMILVNILPHDDEDLMVPIQHLNTLQVETHP